MILSTLIKTNLFRTWTMDTHQFTLYRMTVVLFLYEFPNGVVTA